MGIQVVRVDVDVHEPAAVRAELERLGAEVRVAQLATGDYWVESALVERKTVRDLHLTLVSGRLWGQLGRMRRAGPRAFLLVEGRFLDHGPLAPAAVRGALLAAAENDVTVVRAETAEDSALWVYRIACRARRRPRDRPLYAQRPKPATAEAVLASIPDISSVTARALLAHFGTVAAVVEATDVQLMAVSGIGPVRARRLREALSLHPTSYRSRRSRERPGRAT